MCEATILALWGYQNAKLRKKKRRVNEEVIVRLKWGQTEYKGRLVSVDSYMNIQLTGTEEFINRKSTASLGQVLIRWDAQPFTFFFPFSPFLYSFTYISCLFW
jgi:small nuclear ribonucleoprotein (snRNP)-like protein